MMPWVCRPFRSVEALLLQERGDRVEPWFRVLALSVGGALGVNARYWLGVWMNRWASPRFPWATFTINVSGSFAIGFLTMALARWLPHPHLRLLVLVGFLGGYTTFSTFSFESLTLWERGEAGLSLTYIVGSVVAGLLAVGLGVGLARGFPLPAPERATKDVPPARAGVESGGTPPAPGRPEEDRP
jgi:fluoride exporter